LIFAPSSLIWSNRVAPIEMFSFISTALSMFLISWPSSGRSEVM
jgi:hypothetical protein